MIGDAGITIRVGKCLWQGLSEAELEIKTLLANPFMHFTVNKTVNKILTLLTVNDIVFYRAYVCKSLWYKHLGVLDSPNKRVSPRLLTTGSVVQIRAGEFQGRP